MCCFSSDIDFSAFRWKCIFCILKANEHCGGEYFSEPTFFRRVLFQGMVGQTTIIEICVAVFCFLGQWNLPSMCHSWKILIILFHKTNMLSCIRYKLNMCHVSNHHDVRVSIRALGELWTEILSSCFQSNYFGATGVRVGRGEKVGKRFTVF